MIFATVFILSFLTAMIGARLYYYGLRRRKLGELAARLGLALFRQTGAEGRPLGRWWAPVAHGKIAERAVNISHVNVEGDDFTVTSLSLNVPAGATCRIGLAGDRFPPLAFFASARRVATGDAAFDARFEVFSDQPGEGAPFLSTELCRALETLWTQENLRGHIVIGERVLLVLCRGCIVSGSRIRRTLATTKFALALADAVDSARSTR